MSAWYSIEVIDGVRSAASWAEVWSDTLSGAALSSGATDWDWHEHSWGVVFEVELADDAAWEQFRELAPVRAALDSVPDPVSGLIVYRGRGGSSGAASPRRPRPMIGSGSAELPLPLDLFGDVTADLTALLGPASPRPLLVGTARS